VIPIGEVARRTGTAASALRYYERTGLIPRASRHGGRRVFREEVLDRLALIGVAKAAGFRLSEIRQLLAGLGRRTPPGKRWAKLAARKNAEIRQRLADLARARALLDTLEGCRCPTLEDCSRALRTTGRCP
jgi:MerR family transcriptional regulator, redox-sensitive transcriptional activator SoxR